MEEQLSGYLNCVVSRCAKAGLRCGESPFSPWEKLLYFYIYYRYLKSGSANASEIEKQIFENNSSSNRIGAIIWDESDASFDVLCPAYKTKGVMLSSDDIKLTVKRIIKEILCPDRNIIANREFDLIQRIYKPETKAVHLVVITNMKVNHKEELISELMKDGMPFRWSIGIIANDDVSKIAKKLHLQSKALLHAPINDDQRQGKNKTNNREPRHSLVDKDITQLIYASVFQKPGIALASIDKLFENKDEQEKVCASSNATYIDDLKTFRSIFETWILPQNEKEPFHPTQPKIAEEALLFYLATVALMFKTKVNAKLRGCIGAGAKMKRDQNVIQYFIGQNEIGKTKLFNSKLSYSETSSILIKLLSRIEQGYVLKAFSIYKTYKNKNKSTSVPKR